jgi:TatD DNase family protein
MTPPIPRVWPLVDSHAHLDDPRLRDDLPAVLDRARAAGLVQIVAIGTTAADSPQVIEIATSSPGLFAAVGVQPNKVAEAKQEDWARIVELASSPRVVAIGETGLDRYWKFTPFLQQEEWFQRHLALAHDLRLPVVIHCRDCEADIVRNLEQLGRPVSGVLHSFTGDSDHAAAFLALGLHLSYSGIVTFSSKTHDSLRAAAATVPLDRLIVETDSPYLSPQPVRGRPNQPAFLSWTTQFLAQLLHISPEDLAKQTTSNAQRLFALSPDDTL